MLKLLLYEAGTEIWPICNLIWQLPIYVFQDFYVHIFIVT